MLNFGDQMGTGVSMVASRRASESILSKFINAYGLVACVPDPINRTNEDTTLKKIAESALSSTFGSHHKFYEPTSEVSNHANN